MTKIRARAGLVEVALVLVATVAVWRLVMGWDWSVVPGPTPDSYRDPNGAFDWVLVHATAAAGTGWLAWRGRPVLGAAGVVLALVVLSGWRMAVAEVIGANLWPVGVAMLTVTLTLTCVAAALAGGWLRQRAHR
ncbi:hypothetical protein [Phytohabitans kaempferiae]|uniref:Integral membrane protein n=1 Tax=Phytohabitans kaempferiae TaxID=1620943 RepID=A0ABV6LZW5_9ACTN